MVPTVYIVACPSHDWGVVYFVSNISDRKVYEGPGLSPLAILALAELFGCRVQHMEFTDNSEFNGCTPHTFKSIQNIRKL